MSPDLISVAQVMVALRLRYRSLNLHYKAAWTDSGEESMWLLKGIVLGAVLFVIGFFAYAFAVARRIHLRTEYGLGDLLTTLTFRNPYFWLAFAGALMIGCAMVRSWRVGHS